MAVLVYVHVRVALTWPPEEVCTVASISMVPEPVGRSITGMVYAKPLCTVRVATTMPFTLRVREILLPVSVDTV